MGRVVPLAAILAFAGMTAAFAGTSGEGRARLDLTLNLDDPNGTYTVWCRDRASGLTAEKKIVCEGALTGK